MDSRIDVFSITNPLRGLVATIERSVGHRLATNTHQMIAVLGNC